MEFLDISSLGSAYRYVVKIEQNLKKNNKWDFSSSNPLQKKHGKGGPKSQKKEQSKDGQPQENRKSKKDIGKWCKFHKIPWHNTNECFSK
jgi:hypothetical protein